MGLRQTVSEWITVTKDALDFGPEFPAAMAAHHRLFDAEMSRLAYLLEQTQQAAREKDRLIARLQAAGATQGLLVIDGPACFIRKGNLLDGPFCMSCFHQRHEAVRIEPAGQPQGADGPAAEWVQCARCRTPFRSERLGQFLNPGDLTTTRTPVPAEADCAAEGRQATKPRARAHRKPAAGASR